MSQEEKDWLKETLDRVVPLTPEEVDGLLECWKKLAWFASHDPDCAQDFLGAESMQLRLIVTLQKVWEQEKKDEKRRVQAEKAYDTFLME